MPVERRGPTIRQTAAANQRWEEPVPDAKPYQIPKQLVWEAYKRVKANRGAAGVDGETVTMVLEPVVEPRFHPDSYGYRPGRSALDAVGRARERCWRADWVIDLDITAFFDSLDHDLVERAVAHCTDNPWVKLYVGRWLRAPSQREDGTLEKRSRGTPQGGVVSPLLSNLFLHYVFDMWMQRT